MKRYIKSSNMLTKDIASEVAAAIRNINLDYKVPMVQTVNGERTPIYVPVQTRAEVRTRSNSAYVLFSLNIWTDLPMKIKTKYMEAIGYIIDEMSQAYPDFDIQYDRYVSEDAFRGSSSDAIVVRKK